MKTRSRLTAIALTAALAVSVIAQAPLAAGAQTATASPASTGPASTMTLAQGDTIRGYMENSLDSGTAYVGETFTMQVVPPYPEGDQDLTNATISGQVIKVVRAAQGTNPELHLAFTTLTLQDGTSYPLDAQMTAAQEKQDSKNGGHVAMTTVGGMVIGNVIGKTIFHSGLGGLLGAAGGFLAGFNQKSNVRLGRGAQVSLTLIRPLVVRRQATQPS